MKSFKNFPALILLSLSIHPQPYLKHILAIQPCFVMSYQNEQNNEYEKEVGMLFCNEQLPRHVQADGDDVLCLQWWLKIHKQYLLLFKMDAPILSNFNAPKVKSSFSVTVDVVDKKCGRMNMETYSGIQTIKYSLETNRSANQVSLHNSFLKFNLYTSRVTS